MLLPPGPLHCTPHNPTRPVNTRNAPLKRNPHIPRRQHSLRYSTAPEARPTSGSAPRRPPTHARKHEPTDSTTKIPHPPHRLPPTPDLVPTETPLSSTHPLPRTHSRRLQTPHLKYSLMVESHFFFSSSSLSTAGAVDGRGDTEAAVDSFRCAWKLLGAALDLSPTL